MKNKVKQPINTKKQKGITIIALVITIVILLILAGVTIGTLTGENGLIGNSREAKEKTEIENEKEVLEQAAIEAIGKDKYGNITEENLQKVLNMNYGENRTEVILDVSKFIVKFIESNRFYQVDYEGKIEKYDVYVDSTPGELATEIQEDENGNKITTYKIESIEDLVTFSKNVNSLGNKYTSEKVVLSRNLDFQSRFSYCDYQTTEYAGYLGGDGTLGLMQELSESGSGFKSIGNRSMCFSGIFDGQNYEIRNMITKEGLFGIVKNATIKNITITGVIVNNNGYAGGIVNSAETSNIENCCNKVNIKASDGYVMLKGTGGIVGTLDNGTITNCYNKGKIVGESYVGGIAGFFIGTIINCYNTGEIISNSTQTYIGTGGIVGGTEWGESQINKSYNIGIIKGKNAGGIVGKIRSSGTECTKVKIINCYNANFVSGNTEGGVVGVMESASTNSDTYCYIQNCYNIGDIGEIESESSGGLVGCAWRTYTTAYVELEITNCYNAGYIKGNKKAEIIGKQYNIEESLAKVHRCYFVSTSGLELIGAGKITETETEGYTNENMKIEIFGNKLNENVKELIHESEWEEWKQDAGSYPTL